MQHGYDWDKRKSKLKRNRDYWIQKIEENIARDSRVDKQLLASDWIPIHFWSKDVIKNTDSCVAAIKELAFDILVDDTLDQYVISIEDAPPESML